MWHVFKGSNESCVLKFEPIKCCPFDFICHPHKEAFKNFPLEN